MRFASGERGGFLAVHDVVGDGGDFGGVLRSGDESFEGADAHKNGDAGDKAVRGRFKFQVAGFTPPKACREDRRGQKGGTLHLDHAEGRR